MKPSSSLNYLENCKILFRYYKSLGDKALAQVSEEALHFRVDPHSNNLAIIVKHMSGNMLSRWTDFLQSDGEKEWRNREAEFEDTLRTKAEVLAYWEKGWACLFEAIDPLEEADLEKIAFIRNEGHSVLEAINRQLAHYSYHTGQLVFLAKAITSDRWESLSIPKGGSEQFNSEKFKQEKSRKNFI